MTSGRLNQPRSGEIPKGDTIMVRFERAELSNWVSVDRDDQSFATARTAYHRSDLVAERPNTNEFHANTIAGRLVL